MSFSKEMYDLLIRYTKDSEGMDITLPDLQALPYWRCVWGRWMAQAYYGMNNFYSRLEDAPLELPSVYVINNDAFTSYKWTDKYEVINSMDKATCKSVYGN